MCVCIAHTFTVSVAYRYILYVFFYIQLVSYKIEVCYMLLYTDEKENGG